MHRTNERFFAMDARARLAASGGSSASSNAIGDAVPEEHAHRFPADSHCPFLMLATIEIQLCMSMLPSKDLLRFARVCTRTAAAARSPFPWSSLVTRVDANTSAAVSLPTGFLRFTPLSLSLSTRRSNPRNEQPKWPLLTANWHRAAHLLSLLDSICNEDRAIARPLHRLELHCDERPFFDWRYWVLDRILVHPALHSLRVLKLTRTAWRNGSKPLMHALRPMRMLNSLWLAPDTDYPFFAFRDTRFQDGRRRIDKRRESSGAWAELSSLSSLTSLTCADTGLHVDGSRLPAIIACSNLRRLTLVWPSLSGANFARFFSAPSMRQLQVLTIDNFDGGVRPNSSDESITLDGGGLAPCSFESAWSCMRSLHSLHLRHVRGIDSLLLSLSSASALTLLTIYPAINPTFIHQQNSKLPTPIVLACLIDSAPLSLRVVLQLPRMSRDRFVPLTVAGYESDVLSLCGRGFSIELVGEAHL